MITSRTDAVGDDEEDAEDIEDDDAKEDMSNEIFMVRL